LSPERAVVASVSRRAHGLRRIRLEDGRFFLAPRTPGTDSMLEKGAVLKEDDIRRLEGELAREAGLVLAYGILSRRERTEAQIRRALISEGIDSERSIGYITGKLKERGHLDDRRFGSQMIDYILTHRPSGPVLIRRKLLEAGVAPELADELLSGHFEPGRERELALEVAGSRMRSLGGVERGAAARRLNGYLMRRGFSASIAGEICSRILRGGGIGEDG